MKRFFQSLALSFSLIFGSQRLHRSVQGTFQVDEDETDRIHRLEHQLCLPKWYGKPRCSTEELIRQQYARQVAFIKKKKENERTTITQA